MLTKPLVQDTFQVSTPISLLGPHTSNLILSAALSPDTGKFLLLGPRISFKKRCFSISQQKAVKRKTEERTVQEPGGTSTPSSHSFGVSSIWVYKHILLLFGLYPSCIVGFIWTGHHGLPIGWVISRDPASSRQRRGKCSSFSGHLNQVRWLTPVLCLFLISRFRDSPGSLVYMDVCVL